MIPQNGAPVLRSFAHHWLPAHLKNPAHCPQNGHKTSQIENDFSPAVFNFFCGLTPKDFRSSKTTAGETAEHSTAWVVMAVVVPVPVPVVAVVVVLVVRLGH